MSGLRRICLVTSVCLAVVSQARADTVYLALGDSATFGIDPSTPAAQLPSFGDQGFVRPFADFLASQNGGVRPDVLNLAIPGELSTTFFTASPPPGWPSRIPALNLNYSGDSTPQYDLMVSSINAIHAAGDTVGYATLLFGSNDIFYLVATPAFQAASAADQLAMVQAALGVAQGNYVAALAALTSLAPEAKIILPSYYNPFPVGTQEHAFYDAVLSGFRPLIEADAAAFGATAVDLAPYFLGRELELTNIAAGDFHPTQLGYSVIAGALARAVPEPSGLLMLGVGGLTCLAASRRIARTRRAA